MISIIKAITYAPAALKALRAVKRDVIPLTKETRDWAKSRTSRSNRSNATVVEVNSTPLAGQSTREMIGRLNQLDADLQKQAELSTELASHLEQMVNIQENMRSTIRVLLVGMAATTSISVAALIVALTN